MRAGVPATVNRVRQTGAAMRIEDRTVGAGPGVPVRIYRPPEAHGAVVWLHGGGFVMGDLDTEHPWAARIADGSGTVVVSVGYRLAPEQRYPAALDDAFAALTWTAGHATDLGIDARRIAVGGHAAGAGLAAAVALRARDEQAAPVAFQCSIVSLSPADQIARGIAQIILPSEVGTVPHRIATAWTKCSPLTAGVPRRGAGSSGTR